ncbi:U3 snoRNP protein [Rhinocladiella similis]
MSFEAIPSRHSPKRRKLSHSSDGSAVEERNDDRAPKSQTVSKKPKNKDNGVLASGINKSSILALQVSDLITEVTPNYDRSNAKWSGVSNRLQNVVKHIKARALVTAVDAVKSLLKEGIRIPFTEPRPSKDTKYKFGFTAPKDIMVGGALSLELSIKGDNLILLTAIMPPETLQEKDYLNNRAPQKAAFYLACIAAGIKEAAGSEFEMSFAYLHGVDYLPVLSLVPKDKSLSKFKFHVGVVFPKDLIPTAKTIPTKNNLRHDANDPLETPTPFYNSSIRYAASTITFSEMIKSAKSAAFDDACRLGQVWLHKLGFASSIESGGFGFLEWSVICALFLRTGGHRGLPLFSKQYSNLQFFKAMLQILATRDFRDPMVLNDASIDIPKTEFPVLYDASTGVNILYKMTPWSYQTLQHHAQISLAAVNARNQDNFDETFVLNTVIPVVQYDEVFRVTVPSKSIATTSELRQYLSKMHGILVRGLGDRVSLANFNFSVARDWPLNHDSVSTNGDLDIEVQLVTNPDAVTRLVDHGPSADEQDLAAEYRAFWGEKAELRRFKDGSISEALVWAPSIPVTHQIIAHLLGLHFKLPPSSISSLTPSLEAVFLPDESNLGAKDAFRVINNAFQTLTSTLHHLQDLPLPIRSISPTDTALRSASVGNPLLPSTAKPIDFLIQFDSSTRWPDSLPAIQHTKIAFLLKVGELLTAQDTSLTTRVGLENTSSATTGYMNTSFLDIIYPSQAPGLSPICFRARILHDRELHLLQTALADKSLHGSARDELASALIVYKREFLAKSAHTSAIRALCARFAALSGTMRLLKRWVAKHLLLGDDHVPEEILEIMATSVFVTPAPWSVPGNATTGFLRALNRLVWWDWTSRPLLVDLGLAQDWSKDSIEAVKTRYEAWRKLDPVLNSVVWFVGTNVDETGVVWTQGGRPTKVVGSRLSALARAAVDVLESKRTRMREEDWMGLFESPLGDFDFVVHIKPGVVKGVPEKTKGKGKKALLKAGGDFKNLQIAEVLDVESLGYDPVHLFVQDLNFAFGASAVFFHDQYGSKLIAGLWKPSALGRREWRVRLGWSSVPVPAADDDDGGVRNSMCVLNKGGILAEIAMLGEEMVTNIATKD